MERRLSTRDLARALVAARVELLSAETTLNALNVFPVPDGDTGTNMRVSLEAGFAALAQFEPAEPDDELRARIEEFVDGMTRAAQGNSGVILAEYVRGFAAVLGDPFHPLEAGLDGPALAEALISASTCARGAVGEPVDGTILSVAHEAALAAQQCVAQREDGRDVAAVARAAHDGAQRALDATPEQLEALVRSRVVDAGGAGLLLVLDALERVASGRGGLPRTNTRSWLETGRASSLEEEAGCHVAAGGCAFEVVCVAEGLDEAAAAKLRDALGRWGDSVVVAGRERLHRLHVHTDVPLVAVSVMREVAALSAVTITRFDGPLPGCRRLLVAARDEAVRAYAQALGAQVRDSREPGAPWGHDEGDVLADADVCAGARSSNLVTLLERLDDAASPFGEWGDDMFVDPDPGGADDLFAAGSDGSSPADVEADGPDVEILRADSWRAARDLVRLHVPGAEAVLVCLAPDAEARAAQEFLDLARSCVEGGSVDVMRLDGGSLVLLEVTRAG